MTRNILLTILSALVAITAAAQVKLGFPAEETASVGIYVKNLRTGRVTASNDAHRLHVPASILKSLTAATAMCALDSNSRFETPVMLVGQREGDTLRGNIEVRSCGDPTIGSGLFPREPQLVSEVVQAVKAEGISRITGTVVVTGDMPDSGEPLNWEIEDVAWPYGAGLFSFNYQDNTLRLWPAMGRTQPEDPAMRCRAILASGSTTIVRGAGSDSITVYSPNASKPDWCLEVSMPRPERVFVNELIASLRDSGVTVGAVPDTAATSAKLLLAHRSPRLTTILRGMMFESHNMFAEAMLQALAPGRDREEAVKALKNVWAERKVSTAHNKITGGSGLARGDLLRPVFLGQVLESMAADKRLCASFVNLFPRAGKEGTVRSLLSKTQLRGAYALKSGSMGGVQCYAGYKLSPLGEPTHVVVVMVNHFTCSRSLVNRAIEKFLTRVTTL